MGVLVKDFGVNQKIIGTYFRDIFLTNNNSDMVMVTLYAEEAIQFNANEFSTIVIRKAIIDEIDGKKKLNCVNGTLVWVTILLYD